MAFRFVHTADIHLDSPLRSLAMRDEEVAGLIETATRRSFANTIQLCLDEQVDALLIAGDLYDGDLRSMKTAAFLVSQLRKLTEAGIPAFIIRGNHDATSRVTTLLTMPDGVHVFSGRGEAVPVDGTDVVVHGVSYGKSSAPESLVGKYKGPMDGKLNVGLLHTSLAGSAEHDNYAPCSLTDLKAHGFDYWALGHIHKRTVHSGTPNAVVMPGIPQGRHINEAGPKSVSLVTIADSGIVIEERVTAIAQFERVGVDLGLVTEWRQAIDRIEAGLQAANGRCVTEHLIVRIELNGTTQLAGDLRRQHDVLGAEILARAQALGRVYVEDTRINLRAGVSRGDVAPDNPVGELRTLVTKDGPAHQGVLLRGRAVLDELLTSLPPEVQQAFLDKDGQDDTTLEGLLADGADEILALLEDDRVEI